MLSESQVSMNNVYKTAMLSLLINIIYGIYNIVVGVIMPSWWFLTAGAYYLILSIVRNYISARFESCFKKRLKPDNKE